MKKNICIRMIVVMVLILSGCVSKNETPPEPVQPDLEQSEPKPTVSPTNGTVETFERHNFTLEVSNVKEIKQGSFFDGMETCEYDIYVVYPGATAKVLNADTSIDEETNLPFANWAFLTSGDEQIDILDGMEPLEITEDILYIFNPESGVSVLEFEMCDNSQKN